MRGSWEQQKRDTVAGVVNYDYFTELYDGNIPVSIHTQGFHTDNRSRQNPLREQAKWAPNVPLDRRDLNTGRNLDGGYYKQDDDTVMLDLVPIIRNQKLPQVNILRNMRNVFPLGVDDADGKFWNGVVTHFKPSPDPGFPIGTLVAPEFPAQGRALRPKLPANFSANINY